MKTVEKMVLMCLVMILSVLSVSGQVINSPQLDINLVQQDPSPVEPGSYVDLTFNVENVGKSTASDVKVRFVESFPFTLYDGERKEKSIGQLSFENPKDPDANVAVVTFRVLVDENAVEGNYDIELEFNEKTKYNWEKSEQFQVRVRSTDALLAIEQVTYNPERLRPGEQGEVVFHITNNGVSDVKFVSFKCGVNGSNDVSVLGSSNERQFFRINSGETVEARYTLIADPNAEAQIVSVPVELSYTTDTGTAATKKSTASVIIDAEPDYILNIEETSVVTRKSKGSIVVSVSNTGPTEIRFMDIELLASGDYQVLSAPKLYVGNLEPDDFETAEFELYVSASEKNVPIKLKTTYRDSYNNKFEEEKMVYLNLFSASEAKKYGLTSGGPNYLMIGAVIVVVGIGAYVYQTKYRKKKKK